MTEAPPHSLGTLPREDAPPPVTLRTYALAGIASQLLSILAAQPDRAEHAFLLRAYHQVDAAYAGWATTLFDYLQDPAPEDWPLLHLADILHLSAFEMLVVTLVVAVEHDLLVGRTVAHVQAPLGSSRPTLGLLGTLNPDTTPDPIPTLVAGRAVRSGLLVLGTGSLPLTEQTARVPLPICLALQGHEAEFPGASLDSGPAVELPDSIVAEAHRQAYALDQSTQRGLVLRTGSLAEGKAVASVIAQALDLRPVYLDVAQPPAGLVPWLVLRALLPVYPVDTTPGECLKLPDLAGYDGPVLAIAGPEGAVERGDDVLLNWSLPVPPRRERQHLWAEITPNNELVAKLARHHRHSSGRIAYLGRVAAYQALLDGRDTITEADLRAAAWASEGGSLDNLALPLPQPITDDALILDDTLRRDLWALMQRCRVRDELVEDLGRAATARYQPGVRALFIGPSGTGKTLAAGWLATQLGLPLYRVDLASVTSKYIGETEKNLAQLLARAEQSEVVLLFDEADSLFGKRTDVQQANDRFANAQTNYLLQRIESYDGIVLLTSNNRSRFDQAFTRRLDMIIEFPLPDPEERRDLWLNHLGNAHTLDRQQINLLAALVDFAGGHIRNAVLSAAARARTTDRLITFEDVLDGLAREYKKLGQQMPVELLHQLPAN